MSKQYRIIDKYPNGIMIIQNRRNNLYNLMSDNAKILFMTMSFNDITYINNGMFLLKYHNQMNITNSNGELLFPSIWFKYIGRFINNKARVQNVNGKWNMIDLNGNIIHEKWMQRIDIFRNGYAKVENTDRKFNLMDEWGNFLLPYWFDKITNNFLVYQSKTYYLDTNKNLHRYLLAI